jgi:cbb3-type cytochrome oxidase subunit 3
MQEFIVTIGVLALLICFVLIVLDGGDFIW